MAIHDHIKDNLSIPVIGSPLFLVSGPELVIAQCKAGIIGSFPALNARPQHVLEEWIIRIKTELAEYQEQNPDAKVAPFAVNQICHALSPFALLREVKQWFDGTVILSGSIGDGYSVASSLALGADFAYMGTRFIATKEANADPEYKKMLEESVADDIVYSSLFTGVHGNYLKPSIKNAGMDPDNLPDADKSTMNFGSGGNTKSKAWKDIWGSGQGIGLIEDSPSVEELVGRIKEEFNSAVKELSIKAK
jgi:nitronate monooxygenase